MSKQKVLNGLLLDEHSELSLNELCRACSSSAEWVIELVEEGILEPIPPHGPPHEQKKQWLFPGNSLHRARTTLGLQRDLGINLAGAALALDLLEEIKSLESQLNMIKCHKK
ncbi:MAG TPA: MerR family transcriptional regulator [Gammaproteobacteria bacterium]|nr:MerR family transcriptional regulator [Gammaproteobacteria bacterium]